MNKRQIQKVVQQQRRREWVGHHEVAFITNAESRGIRPLSISEISAAATEKAISQRQSRER